jgi:hypothetical protein
MKRRDARHEVHGVGSMKRRDAHQLFSHGDRWVGVEDEGTVKTAAWESMNMRGEAVLGWDVDAKGPDEQKRLAQSWGLIKTQWLWVRRGTPLDSTRVLGSPASAMDMQRFGSATKKPVQVKPTLRDERSFAEVVKDRVMARDARKVAADLAMDRQGGQAEDENRFKNR